MTSSGLQALMSFKTRSTEEYLADETVRGSGVVLITTAAFLGLCAAIFKSENIHQSVEMIRCRQMLERVSFRNLKRCLTNRAFDCRLKVSSCKICVFVKTLEAEWVNTWQGLGIIDCLQTQWAFSFLFKNCKELLNIHGKSRAVMQTMSPWDHMIMGAVC